MAFSVAFIIAFFHFTVDYPRLTNDFGTCHFIIIFSTRFDHTKSTIFSLVFLSFLGKVFKNLSSSCRNGHTHIHHAKYRLLISFFRSSSYIQLGSESVNYYKPKIPVTLLSPRFLKYTKWHLEFFISTTFDRYSISGTKVKYYHCRFEIIILRISVAATWLQGSHMLFAFSL